MNGPNNRCLELVVYSWSVLLIHAYIAHDFSLYRYRPATSCIFFHRFSVLTRVLPHACAKVIGRILETHSFGRNSDEQRDVCTLMPSWVDIKMVFKGKI